MARGTAFADFLQGLWHASGSGTNQTAAVDSQRSLEVQPNPWFGVIGGKTVNVVWVYNNRVKNFYDSLSPSVQAILGDFVDPKSFSSFPNYGTFDTHLTPTEINLLASLNAWVVAADENKAVFEALFRS